PRPPPPPPPPFFVKWLVANLVVLGAWAWWLPKISQQAHGRLRNWWIEEPTAEVLWEAVNDLYGVAQLGRVEGVGIGLLVCCGALGVWAWRGRPWSVGLSLGLGLGGVLLLFGLSFWRPMFLSRAVLWTTVPIAALVAGGVMGLRPWPVRGAVLVVLLGLYGKNVQSYHRFVEKPAWDAVAEYVETRDEPGDLVVFLWAHDDAAFDYYYPERSAGAPRRIGLVRDPSAEFVPGVDPALSYVTLERVPYDVLPSEAVGYGRVWVVTERGDEHLPAELQALGALEHTEVFREIRVMRFAGVGPAAEAGL
ncbi:MAG: hypothetical protein AAGG38_14370, partial [Planctomycetota bacterium]